MQLPEAETQTTSTGPRFGRFLKGPDLERILDGDEYVIVGVDARAPNASAVMAGEVGPAPNENGYGADIPVTIEGIPFVATCPQWSPDYAKLKEAFGADGGEWVGHQIRLGVRNKEVNGPDGKPDPKLTKKYLTFEPIVNERIKPKKKSGK